VEEKSEGNRAAGIEAIVHARIARAINEVADVRRNRIGVAVAGRGVNSRIGVIGGRQRNGLSRSRCRKWTCSFVPMNTASIR